MAERLVIGFTGTRDGMTSQQADSVQDLLKAMQPAEVHHGDCIGADAYFHRLVLWHTSARIVIHPPTNEYLRAFCEIPDGLGEVLPALHYLLRNRSIVSAAGVLIATPKSMTDKRGGTWFTIREAKRTKHVIFVRPDGEYESY